MIGSWRAGNPEGPLKNDDRTEVGSWEDIVRGGGRERSKTAGKRKAWCATNAPGSADQEGASNDKIQRRMWKGAEESSGIRCSSSTSSQRVSQDNWSSKESSSDGWSTKILEFEVLICMPRTKTDHQEPMKTSRPGRLQNVPDGRNYTSTTGFVVCLDFFLRHIIGAQLPNQSNGEDHDEEQKRST